MTPKADGIHCSEFFLSRVRGMFTPKPSGQIRTVVSRLAELNVYLDESLPPDREAEYWDRGVLVWIYDAVAHQEGE